MYYCSRCGKKISYDSSICRECSRSASKMKRDDEDVSYFEEDSFVSEDFSDTSSEYEAPVRDTSTRMKGFPLALTGVILDVVSTIVMGIGIGLYGFFPAVGLIVLMISAIMCLVSVIGGIRSIVTFVKVKRSGGAVPVATLVLGIASIGVAAIILLYVLILAAALGLVFDDGYYGGDINYF